MTKSNPGRFRRLYRKIPYPVQLLIFWMSLFFFFRLLFFAMHNSQLGGNTSHQLFAFVAALRLDLSMSCYLIAIPFIFWLLELYFPKGPWHKTGNFFNYLLIPLTVSILVSNIGLYESWKTLLNKRLLLYLQNPAEISHFMDTWKIVALPFLLIALSWLFIFIWKKISTPHQVLPFKWTAPLIGIPLVFLGIRGGLQLLPINESSASYSSFAGNNHLAINPVYYFSHSVSEFFYVSNKYHFYAQEEADKILSDYFTEEKSAQSDTLLNSSRANVVFILLESWTADILQRNGELKGVAPFTDSLINESLWFSQAYASGYRTDQGLVAVLSGYPSQPDNTILAYPAKTEQLPCIADDLKKRNYATSFFYGGDIEFANMGAYLNQHSIDVIFDKNAFDPKEFNSKWGAHDGSVMNKQIAFLENEKQPFFSGLLTLSTHEPWEVPIATPFQSNTDHDKFCRSAYYTDQCLRDYFTAARKSKWYNNTLIVLVADHGHYLPLNRNLNKAESRKITLILTGGALHASQRGRVIDRVVAQHDLAGTIAGAFGLDAEKYIWSRNLLTSKKGFASFCNENVSGIVVDGARHEFYFANSLSEGNPEFEILNKAYLQKTYADFVAR